MKEIETRPPVQSLVQPAVLVEHLALQYMMMWLEAHKANPPSTDEQAQMIAGNCVLLARTLVRAIAGTAKELQRESAAQAQVAAMTGAGVPGDRFGRPVAPIRQAEEPEPAAPPPAPAVAVESPEAQAAREKRQQAKKKTK